MNYMDAIWNDLKPILEKHISALEPKKEVKAREFLVYKPTRFAEYKVIQKNPDGSWYLFEPVFDRMDTREILPHERVIDKETLTTAVRKAHYDTHFPTTTDLGVYDRIANNLGFPPEETK